MDEHCSKQQRNMISDFQKELASLRKAAHVSQTKLGKKIGMSRQFVSEIERGEASMSLPIYVATVKFFMINGNKVIKPFIDEHVKFLDQYMKEELDIDNAGGHVDDGDKKAK